MTFKHLSNEMRGHRGLGDAAKQEDIIFEGFTLNKIDAYRV
jgi:hypothetical protein